MTDKSKGEGKARRKMEGEQEEKSKMKTKTNSRHWRNRLLYDLPIKHLGGHVSFKLFGRRVTIYGFNAMWLTINIHTRRWGYVCFRPPTWHPKLRWKFYVSPNATPWAATFATGSGVDRDDKRRSPLRRAAFGHNFDVGECWRELCFINDKNPDAGSS